MLGESFIHILKYTREDGRSPDLNRPMSTPSVASSAVPSADGHHSSSTLAHEGILPSLEPAAPAVKCTPKQSGSKTPCTAPGLSSYHCVSHGQDPGDISRNVSPTYLDLQARSPSNQHCQPCSPTDCGPRQLRSIPAEQTHVHDDGYLVMDSSISLNGEPPTNSMLNGYLDRKLREVYSQYLQERLACPSSSLPCSMIPLLPQASVFQLSQQLSLESSLELPQELPSQRVSSHFSSPLLRISTAEQPKYLRPPDYL